MNKWQVFYDKCIREIAEENVVVNIGSGISLQKGLKEYERLLKSTNYVELDYDIRYRPHIVGNIQSLPFRAEAVDAIICNSVLEHVPEPQVAVREMYRLLREGGKIFVYVPFFFPYHGGQRYKDYYRFTKDAIEYMFQDFTEMEMVPVRGYFGTINLFAPFTSKNFWLTDLLDKWKGTRPRMTSGYNIFAVK